MSNVTQIHPDTPTDDSKEIAVSYIRQAMDELIVNAAALSNSRCRVARAVGYRLGEGMLHNDLDVARELLEKGSEAIALTGASIRD
jgi:hypothetical protein